MKTLRLLPDDLELSTTDGTSILEAAIEHGAPFAHACGGHARCSTCRVVIVDGLEGCAPRTEAEQRIADHLEFPDEIRLACQTKACNAVTARRLVLDDVDIELTSRLVANPQAERVGIEKEVCILFADIRAFTAFAEAVLPYDVIFVLNRYFRLMEDVITRHGGVIDNYMGDGLMALFEGGTAADIAHASVSAGLEMLRVVDEDLRPYLEHLVDRSFDIGIGLHFGLVVAGTVGGSDRRRSTVIGDAVNFASRIEAANKKAGTRLLVSDDVATLVDGKVLLGKTSSVEIRGKRGEHRLHEIVGLR